jgi:hypothetical protein
MAASSHPAHRRQHGQPHHAYQDLDAPLLGGSRLSSGWAHSGHGGGPHESRYNSDDSAASSPDPVRPVGWPGGGGREEWREHGHGLADVAEEEG